MAVNNLKPPIFWKDKQNVISQARKWNRKKINSISIVIPLDKDRNTVMQLAIKVPKATPNTLRFKDKTLEQKKATLKAYQQQIRKIIANSSRDKRFD